MLISAFAEINMLQNELVVLKHIYGIIKKEINLKDKLKVKLIYILKIVF